MYNREDFLGPVQREACDLIDGMVKKGAPYDPLLFVGPSGVGKTSLALYFASKVNGMPEEGRPVSDIIELYDCAGSVNKGEIDKLMETLHLKPMFSTCRILFLDEVHGLHQAAQNALLVPTEDQSLPPHIIMVAATTEPQKIIRALQSRMTRIDLPPPPPQEVKNYLESQLDDPEIAAKILMAFPTNMREMKRAVRHYKETGTMFTRFTDEKEEPALFTQIMRVIKGKKSLGDIVAIVNKLVAVEQEAANLGFYCMAVSSKSHGRRDADIAFANAYIQFYGESGLVPTVAPKIALASILSRAYAHAKKYA